MDQMKNSTEFLSTYNELDEYLRRKLNADDNVPHRTLIERVSKKDKSFEKYKEDLIDFAKLRNAIVHNPYKNIADPIAEPHDYIVNKYRDIKDRIINPPKAIDIAVSSKHIFSAGLDSSIIEVMHTMNKGTYTHVPILKSNRVIGVFSQFTVFSYLVTNDEPCLRRDMKVRDLIEMIPLDNHPGEYFKFVSKNTLVAEVEEMFQTRLNGKKRLGIVFITENGNQEEKLIGIITPGSVARHI